MSIIALFSNVRKAGVEPMTAISTGGATKAEFLKLAVQTDGVASQITTNVVDLIGLPGSSDGEILAIQYNLG